MPAASTPGQPEPELGSAARHDPGDRTRPMAAPRHPGPPAAVLPQAGRSAGGHQPRQLRGPAGDPGRAAAELVLLDYDFHLFTERSAGQDSVIYRTPGGYRLAMARPKRPLRPARPLGVCADIGRQRPQVGIRDEPERGDPWP